MSNLRLLNDTTATNVASVSVTDVFTTDFSIYKIITNQTGFSGNTSIEGQYLSLGGNVIEANYDLARMLLKSSTSGTQERTTNNADFRSFGEADNMGAGSISYVFNPMDGTSYTWFINQNTSGVGYFMKGVSVLRELSQVAGIKFFTDSGGNMTNFNCKIYGLRKD